MISWRRIVRTVLQFALLLFLGGYLYINWDDYEHAFSQPAPHWGLVALSSLVVIAAYAVLIQTWRQVVVAWGERLTFPTAMRIWFVSNLGKYVPGKVWAIAAMGTLAQEQGISPAAAMGSSVVVQLVNLVTGFGVFFVAGANVIDVPAAALAGALGLGIMVFSAPWLVPAGVRFLNTLTGRQVKLPHLPPRAIWWAAAGTTLAWVLYGVAFHLFVSGMLRGPAPGTLGDWTAIFIGPYLIGFLAVFAPGGAGVREVFMAEALQRTGLVAAAVAALLVVSSRVWLTILEIIPGVLFLLVSPSRRSDSSSDQ